MPTRAPGACAASGPPPARWRRSGGPGPPGSFEPRTSPSRMCRSVRHTPHAWTSTRTSPGRAGSQLRVGQLARLQRATGLVEDHGAHRHMIYPRKHGGAHRQLRPRQAQPLQRRGSSAHARSDARALRVRRHRVRRRPRPDRRHARHLAHDPRRLRAAAALRRGPRRTVHALPRARLALDRRGRPRGRPGRRRGGAQQPVRGGRRARSRPVGARRLRAHAPQPGRVPCGLRRPVPGVRREPQRRSRPRARGAPDPRWAKLRELRLE